MATIPQIQKGFTRFVDNHLSGAFDGWQKAIVAGAAGLIASNFPKLATAYASNPIVVAMGIYEPSSGTINVDALYNAFVLKMGTDKIPIAIPKIGTIKLGREEFETLIRYIKEA
jgi:hypothetical protein